MPLFFVTSGIFFHLGNIFQKVKRLLIPLFSFNFVALCFYSGIDLLRLRTIDTAGLILGMIGFSCPHNPPLWFLISLIEILLLAHFMIKNMNSSYAITVSLLVGLTGFLLSSRFKEMPFYIVPTLMCLPHFLMGYYLKERILGLKTKYLLLALLVSVFLFLLKPVIPTLSDGLIPQGYLLFFVCSFFGSLGIYGICRVMKGYIGSALDYFGRNSLIILCTHWFLLPIPYHLLNVTNNSVLSVFSGFAIILLLEVSVVFLINHKMSFMLGK